jgi:LacI family transcriptional regulator
MSSTISDVAARAGVAKSTVSAVLNNKTGVRTATRRRILQVMEELGYRPSQSARRGFRSTAGKSVTLVIKEAQNPYYVEIFGGAQEVGREAGYLISVASSEGEYGTEQEIVARAVEQEVSGLIIAPVLTDESDLSHLFELRRNRVPFVLLEAVRGVRASLVDIDNIEASAQAVTHLIELGHARIVHFAGPAYSQHSEERAEGMRRAFSRCRLVLDESMIVPVGDSSESGYRAALRFFQSGERPTGITCYNDLVALGVLKALRELGLSIPRDVSVIGFDDLRMLDLFPLALTSVRVPMREMGRRAAEMLIRQMQGTQDTLIERELLDAPLVVRHSSGPPPAAAGREGPW